MPNRKYRIRRRDLRHLRATAVANAKNGREVCGLLVDNGYFLQLRESRNISKKEGSYRMDMREVCSLERAAEKLNLEVIGTYHSHTIWFAEPGDSDIAGTWDNSLMLIVDAMHKGIKLWRIKNGRAYHLSFETI